MKQKKTNAREIFLQRRYGVSLGRRYALAAASVVLMGMLGCSAINGDNTAVAESYQPRTESPMSNPTAKPDTKLVAANTKFGFKLFSEILKSDTNTNVFVSPSSIAMALAMTYNGANGSTQQAIAHTLELQGLSLQQINSSNAALKALLENPDPQVKLAIANSLWANQDATLNPDFLQRNREFYQAKVTNLDFNDANAPNIINTWVKDNTNGKIEEIVQELSPDQLLLLINAIYFKGNWTEKFDKNQTKEYPFFAASGQQKPHPMMSQNGDYKYLENEQFQAISLPYGKDGRISFYVFLPKKDSPKKDSNLTAFYSTLNAENWDKWMTQFSKRQGSIRLPRLKMDYEITLNDALKALGMGEAFSNKADFSGIAKNLSISEVKHKTFVEVNEEGTEAAAATSVEMVLTSAFEPAIKPFEMIVDRPFFACIRDNQTGSILFMGSIAKPQS
ncbi:serpin family protein [Brunnivagina elsteri]|uniref:Proteinase inhibitor I4 serpin n=1 Tax=Brunnivagina elsteri CCALA 953 TaxID=987040 RepID=A0A2A2TJJ7_9CYAN|nr:serpin family protein [Calothrix elsteri]PAX55181.1 proteinase inhibitor I4 serpin [Calothrix elsteri CCALA 953]